MSNQDKCFDDKNLLCYTLKLYTFQCTRVTLLLYQLSCIVSLSWAKIAEDTKKEKKKFTNEDLVNFLLLCRLKLKGFPHSSKKHEEYGRCKKQDIWKSLIKYTLTSWFFVSRIEVYFIFYERIKVVLIARRSWDRGTCNLHHFHSLKKERNILNIVRLYE